MVRQRLTLLFALLGFNALGEDSHEHEHEEYWGGYKFDEVGTYALNLFKEADEGEYHEAHMEFMFLELGDYDFDDVDVEGIEGAAIEGLPLEHGDYVSASPVTQGGAPVYIREVHMETSTAFTTIYLTVSAPGNYGLWSSPSMDAYSAVVYEPDGHKVSPYEEEDPDDDDKMSNAEVWGFSLLGSTGGTIASLAAVGALSFIDKWDDIEAPFTWFASGVISAVGGMHLIGEVSEMSGGGWVDIEFGICFLFGIFIGLCIEQLASAAHQEKDLQRIKSTKDIEMTGTPNEAGEKTGKEVAVVDDKNVCEGLSYTCIIGDAFHNFFDGFIIAQSFDGCSMEKGWIVSVAILVHELPQEISDFTVLIRSGCSVWNAMLANVACSLSSFIGVFVYMGVRETFEEKDIAYCLAISAGVFIFIGIELVRASEENLAKAPKYMKGLCLLSWCVGIGLMAGLMQWHPHCHAEEEGGEEHHHHH